MAQVPPIMSGTNPSDSAGNSSGTNDPFLSLYKMSTTAGLGTTEYVAINGLAIFALVIGLASALIFFSNVLVVLPVTGAIAGIVALKKISDSNGTQTGRGLAVLGLLLSLGLGGYQIGKQVLDALASRGDEQEISTVISALGQDINAGRFKEAYARFTPKFKEKVKEEEFTARLKTITSVPVLGPITSLEWNRHTQFETDPVTDAKTAATMAFTKFAKVPDNAEQQTVLLRKSGNGWLIDAMPQFFATDSPQGSNGSAPRTAQGGDVPGGVPADPSGPPVPSK